LRFLPDISYGTENYPEKVARRLRALNLIAWSTAAITIGISVLDFLDPKPWLWKHVTINVLTALIWASIPFLHRLGILWKTLILDLDLFGRLINEAGFRPRLVYEKSLYIESMLLYELQT